MAGWFSDPTGRKELRYWDGAGWTDHVSVSGAQSTDAITSDYAAPSSPPAGARLPAKKGKKWPWVLALCVLVGLGGCTAIFVAAVDKAVENLNADQKRHAITQAQFDAVAIGTTQDDVIAAVGKEPEDTQEFVSKGVVDESELRSSCIYYNKAGGEFGDRYQFCFDNGVLRSKNSY